MYIYKIKIKKYLHIYLSINKKLSKKNFYKIKK